MRRLPPTALPLRAALLAIALLGAVLALTADPAHAKPLRNGVIAYAVQRCYDPNQSFDCSTRVRTVGPRGRSHRRLPCSEPLVRRCADRYPRFSPNGRRLATVQNEDFADSYLAIRTLRGRVLNRRLVREGVADLAWGPLGRSFAVNDFERIQFLDRSTGRLRLYRKTGGADVAWSRQGRLAWSNSPAGTLVVTDRRKRNIRRYRVRGGASIPRWSPSGERLAYFSVLGSGAYAINADGTGRRLLSRRCGGTEEDSLAWSPDGRRIACTTDLGDLVTIDVRTRRSRLLVSNIYPLDIDWQARTR